MFDQRGAGQSTPLSELRENTTQDLIRDTEQLREMLGIDKWVVFGGSWGSTLSLAYSQAHPSRVKALVLRGIFMCRKQEIDFFYQSGSSFIFPDAFKKYREFIPEEERGDLVKAYRKREKRERERDRERERERERETERERERERERDRERDWGGGRKGESSKEGGCSSSLRPDCAAPPFFAVIFPRVASPCNESESSFCTHVSFLLYTRILSNTLKTLPFSLFLPQTRESRATTRRLGWRPPWNGRAGK